MHGKKFVAPEIRIHEFRKKVNTTTWILGATFLLASILFHINIIRYHAPVEYSKINFITLKDFVGLKPPAQTLEGSKEFAFITTSLTYNRHGNAVEIKALFHPSRSYVFNENVFSNDLLKHELYHFRITELYARKTRQKLSTYQEMPTSDEISYILAGSRTEEREMQSRYDYETYHSYVLKKQHEWQITIDSLLSSLTKFEQISVQYPHE